MANTGEEVVAQIGDDRTKAARIIEAEYNSKITEISLLQENTEIQRHQITITIGFHQG